MRTFNLKSISNWLVALAMVVVVGGTTTTLATPQTAVAASTCSSDFLGFPTWYRGLLAPGKECNIKSPTEVKPDGLSSFIWVVGLNIVEIVMVAIAYISGFYFLYGGFLFIVSQGKPDGAVKARMTMLQALVGLIIGMVASAIVNFIVAGIMG